MFWFLLAIVAIGAAYVFLKRPHKYWTKKGVVQGQPVFILGDTWRTTFQKESFAEMVQRMYNISPESRYCGAYQFSMPTLIVRDPELIKQVAVKDFDHFLNHQTFVPENCDPLWENNLFSLKDQKWRDMRSTLSPAFTSSKMKQMFSLISENGSQFASYFLQQNQDLITVEMKDTFTRFCTDVIANTVFGVKCDSLEDPKNEFFLMGKKTTDFGGIWQNLKFIGYFIVPRIFQILKVSLFPKAVNDFYIKLVKEIIVSREQLGIVRPDMMHLLLEARKNGFKQEESDSKDTGFATVEEFDVKSKPVTKMQITDLDIAAQALIFYFGGFDSVSGLMCFMSYELALNPDVQEKLRREVDDTFERCKGTLTYEAITEMKYMDMVMSESLRMWPIAVVADRICTKPYTIQPQNPNEEPIVIDKDTLVWIPIYAIQRDSQYFPEPDRFDPERFNDENKNNIEPYTYLPFGAGPRNCIGSRFALLETKALFFHLMVHFEIIPIEKTQIPLQLNRKSFNMTAENGFWLGLKRRHSNTQHN